MFFVVGTAYVRGMTNKYVEIGHKNHKNNKNE